MTADSLQEIIARSPFLSWLGLQVLQLQEDYVEVKATWREEWVANPTIGQTQGGILAALIDFAADYALFQRLHRPVPTVDMRVDYHKLAKRGDLIAKGRVIKFGRQISVCEAQVVDEDDVLIASGRGTFLTSTPSPP